MRKKVLEKVQKLLKENTEQAKNANFYIHTLPTSLVRILFYALWVCQLESKWKEGK